MVKLLKIKIGSVFVEGKAYDVFNEAWEKEGKDGNTYYETRNPVFVNQIETKPKEEKITA